MASHSAFVTAADTTGIMSVSSRCKCGSITAASSFSAVTNSVRAEGSWA
jgi:hypothetical protein